MSEPSTPPPPDVGTKEEEIYAQRLEKAAKWRERGANPYGNGFRPEHLAKDILSRHEAQSAEDIEKLPPPAYQIGRAHV